MKRVLLCVDHALESSEFSPSAASTVTESILAFAEALSAEMHVLHVADPEPAFVEHDADTHEQRDAIAKGLRAAHAAVEQIADRLRAAGFAATPHVIRGATADTILDLAERIGADAIVVGSNGHNRIRSLLLGSVTDALLRRSTVPVIVVPSPSPL